MLHLSISLRALAFVLLLGIVLCIDSDVARGAPAAANLTADTLISFLTQGQDQAHDINVADNKGGLRFYGCPALTVIPDCAAIQFFGNQSSGFPGQLFIDSGANNNAAIIFRSAGSGGAVGERMRVTSGGNVGIGTSTPGEKLSVRGSERLLGESNPVEKGSVTSANLNGPDSVFISDSYAYVAADLSNRLVVVDVSNPTAPVEVGSVTSANLGAPTSVFVSGRYAYVAATNNDRLVVVDVSDPTNPVEKGSVTSANLNNPRSVFVSGRYAYVAASLSDRLVVVDVSDPTNPLEKGSVTSANLDGSDSVFVSGRYAYVTAATNDRLVVVDITDPTAPVEVGSVTSANMNNAQSVFVSGRYAYVVASTAGRLTVIDVTDPTAPAEVGSVTSANLGAPTSVFVSGRYAYVAASRLVVVDVSDPTAPVEKGSVTSANLGSPRAVFVSGRYAYVGAFSADRLVVLELDHLETPALDAGTAQVGSLDVRDHAIFNDGLNVRGGLNVGDTGALISGDLTVGGDKNPGEKLRVFGDIRIGTGTTGCVKDADGTTLNGACVSDARLKKDVTPFNPVLAALVQLQPVHFTWRGDEYPDLQLGTARSFGLIADEAAMLPDLVTTNEQGYKVVRYHLLPFLMLQGIRELKGENDGLKEEVVSQQTEIQALRSQLDAQEQRNATLEARLAAIEQRLNGGTATLVAAR